MNTKQVIVIRRDLKMRRGKEIAQGSHASMAWLTNRLSRAQKDAYIFGVPVVFGVILVLAVPLLGTPLAVVSGCFGLALIVMCLACLFKLCITIFTPVELSWMGERFTKVVCQVETESELTAIHEKAKSIGLTSHLITDSGATEFNGVPTKTCCAIGPNLSEEIDKVTGGLKLY